MASRSAAWAWVNVPIRASVSTMPRTVSSPNRRSSISPIGRSNRSFHAVVVTDPPAERVPPSSGSVNVGNTRSATAAVSAVQLVPRRGVGAERRVGCRRRRRRRRGSPTPPVGVYDEMLRRCSRTSSPSSSTICCGQQADEVRVLRQLGRLAREDPFGAGRPTERRRALEHEHRAAGVGEVGGAGQAVVPAADHDGVVGVRRRFVPGRHGRRCPPSPDRPDRHAASPGSPSIDAAFLAAR